MKETEKKMLARDSSLTFARDDPRSRGNPTPHPRPRKAEGHGHDPDFEHDDRHRTREIWTSITVFRGGDVTSGDDGVCKSHRREERASSGVGEGGRVSWWVVFQSYLLWADAEVEGRIWRLRNKLTAHSGANRT